MTRHELIETLVSRWYAKRLWAERLLIRSFGQVDLLEILKLSRGKRTEIPGSHWSVTGHGIGLRIDRTVEELGGIDFDLNKQHPDPWRLRTFAEAQKADGELTLRNFQMLQTEADDWRQIAGEIVASKRHQ